MPSERISAKFLWMQFEDVLAPTLGLTVRERCVYSYLLRHSLVVGQVRLQFAIFSPARTLGISAGLVRDAVRRLNELGTLEVIKRDKTGHLVEMCLPEKIPAIGVAEAGPAGAGDSAASAKLENTDFWKTWALRKAIHDREGGVCFYCLRRTAANVRCLDHVVPRSRLGSNSYRNLVSCCIECNSAKGEMAAPDFLRSLYRKGRLTAKEVDGQMQALKDLAAGKLRPVVP